MHLEDFSNMGPFLKRLEDSRLHSWDTFKDLPQQGVHVFYDGEEPVYVGRSPLQTIKKRLQQHTNVSSSENQAVFAFRVKGGYWFRFLYQFWGLFSTRLFRTAETGFPQHVGLLSARIPQVNILDSFGVPPTCTERDSPSGGEMALATFSTLVRSWLVLQHSTFLSVRTPPA